jgi:hypothetical protein
MKQPSIRYLVASPTGDVPVDDSGLDYPLEADPLKTPYRIYFQAITDFLRKDNFQPIIGIINKSLGTDLDISMIHEIIIRTEKHGALYHPASIECILRDIKAKFALHVAVTDTGKESLMREFNVLKMLRSRFSFPYIPTPYHLDEMHSMVFLLEEWFEDYHEFHIARTDDGSRQMKLWEYGRGYRFLVPEQSFEIYRQTAEILTLYYDPHNFCLIYPWHHAAGDFIAKISADDQIDVRLTTVRGYEPFMGIGEDGGVPPVLALFYFLLHLSIQMRLDKIDGVGDVVWADDLAVDATIAGFLGALKIRSNLRDCCGSVRSFQTLLKSFTAEELGNMFVPIAEQYIQTKDYPVIEKYLKEHVDRLYLTLQNYL